MTKKTQTYFIQDSEDEYDIRQVNLHIGRKNQYWFIFPKKTPIVSDLFTIPDELVGRLFTDSVVTL